MQDKKSKNLILIVSVSLIILFISSITFLKPDVEMSENENRYLQQKPVLSLENVISGSFEQDFENYITDQIAGRETAIKIYTAILKFFGYKDINGVYFTEDNSLCQRTKKSDFNEFLFNKNLEEVKNFCDELEDWFIDCNTMLIYSASNSYQDQSGMYNESIAFDSAYAVLKDNLIAFKGETTDYFRTDHHWNDLGAYKAYCKYKALVSNKTCADYDTISHETLTDSFRGTLYSKVLDDTIKPDEITVPASSFEKNLRVTIEGKEYDSIYFMDRLTSKDKYEVYLGGNYDRVDIEIDGNEDLPKLLIIKDSFANSFVPYLLDDCSQITMLDTRYYKGSALDTAIDEDFDRVLVIYSLNNFAESPIILTSSAVE